MFNLGLPSAALTTASVPAIFGFGGSPAFATARAALPPLAQIKVGRFTVTALSDGYADMPFSYFPGRTPEWVEAEARRQFASKLGGVRFVFNQYLVEDGERRVLIDTGPAGSLGVSGQLPLGLAALGLLPEQIDAVIITHMHQDHMGGLIAGGRPNFTKAEVFVDRRDVTYWTDPARQAAAPDFLQSSFRMASEVIRLYPKLQATIGDHSITRGISLVDLSGHTPGHIGVRIEDGQHSLIMVSDMLFPVVHPAASDTNFLFEQDRQAAQDMRARFFPRAAEEGALIVATHMPFPGLGRVVSDGGRLRWLAADWAHQG
jgi:glyoxylase-like metal-dependent hydrolase (beta-lactamase superfamily II)